MSSTPPSPLPARSIPRWISSLSSPVERLRADSGGRSLVTGLLLWGFFGLFLALVQFSTPDLADNDGFYHIKMAYLMRTEGLKPAFPWLPLTILNPRDFYDHHFLFHVALMPFTFGDLRLGAKWAAVTFASLAFLSVWILLKNQRVPYAALWALGLAAVSEAFIYRMSIPRAQSLSLAVLMTALDWLLRKKYLRLAFLAFAYVWLYDAFPLLAIMVSVFVLVSWPFERRLDLRPLVSTGLGIGLGLVVNPYFPHNIVFAYLHILPKLVDTTAVSVGSEWYPYNTTQLLGNSPFALLAFLGGALALGLSGRRIDLRTGVSFALACLFGFMLFQARRFIEYFPAFALVFAAFAWAPVLQTEPAGEQEPPMGKAGPPEGKESWLFAPLHLAGRMKAWLPALVLILALIPSASATFQAAKASMRTSKPYTTYAGASAWLAANTPAGARLFQTDWDDFPRLFYYNTRNTYLIGLDPTYMLLYDADLYRLWVAITQGKVKQPSAAILREFASRYILTDLSHTAFLERAAADPGLVEVYRDHDAVIFQVRDGGAAP